jgi:hypothetical protein
VRSSGAAGEVEAVFGCEVSHQAVAVHKDRPTRPVDACVVAVVQRLHQKKSVRLEQLRRRVAAEIDFNIRNEIEVERELVADLELDQLHRLYGRLRHLELGRPGQELLNPLRPRLIAKRMHRVHEPAVCGQIELAWQRGIRESDLYLALAELPRHRARRIVEVVCVARSEPRDAFREAALERAPRRR